MEGNEPAFTISTLFPDLTNVGHAPFFTNSMFPLFKSIIEISIVAYVSSLEFKFTAELISPIDISLSNPVFNS